MDHRILVCGGRGYSNYLKVKSTLDKVLKKYPDMMVIEGGCTGADALARRWAKENEVVCLTLPAQWKKYQDAGGPLRNEFALKFKPKGVIAFAGGTGTADMIKRAKLAKVPVMEIA